MLPELLRTLRARRSQIHAHWKMLLRGERVNTALAHPDTLAFMIGSTIEELLHSLECGRPPRQRTHRAACPCGRNPLLAYFHAGEQALLEEMVLAQIALTGLTAQDRAESIHELREAVRGFGDAEVEAFCGLCRYRECALAGAPATAAESAHPS